MGHEFLTIKEVQDLFKISRASVYRFINRGMPVIRHKDIVRFNKSEVIAWFQDKGKTDD